MVQSDQKYNWPVLCLHLRTYTHAHTHTHTQRPQAVVWDGRWKGPLWLGGQRYWPVNVWVESELGFPTVSPSPHSLIPSVNNGSVPWVNKQELSYKHTKVPGIGRSQGAMFGSFFFCLIHCLWKGIAYNYTTFKTNRFLLENQSPHYI